MASEYALLEKNQTAVSDEALAFVNTVALSGGVAGASQSCLLASGQNQPTVAQLRALGAGYLAFLNTLPCLALAETPEGFAVGLAPVPRHLPLLRFASPYLASTRNGRELRYPIVGGLMVRASGGHLAFGVAREGERLRLSIDVWGYKPRLGLGLLYLLTQVQLHRWITITYMRRVVRSTAPA